MVQNIDDGNHSAMPLFTIGQIVHIKSSPSLRGPVIDVTIKQPENRYKVFINNQTHNYYESQLQPEDKKESGLQYLTLSQFHAYLTALQIRHPSISNLYSLNSARIDFIPYQFRPVFKFIRSDRPRLLIADGVGVGKTIEAGLILQELKARQDINSILIICPRPLVIERKWQLEMRRFGERFEHLDSSKLRYCLHEADLDGLWPEQNNKIIIPYSLFDETMLYGNPQGHTSKRRKGLLELDPAPRFDLVIVDEAHHIRNPDTYAHKAVRFFCDQAEAVLFLTATPIQLGSKDLFILLNMLRPDLVIDQKSFEHMAEPNPYVNRAISCLRSQQPGWISTAQEALDSAVKTPWGQSILQHNPQFQQIKSSLGKNGISDYERIELINSLESIHTFSGIISRTRRRDIGEFTVRKPQTVNIEFTSEQKALHDDLLNIQAEILGKLHNDTSINFMMTTLRRQAASCIYGLAPLLEDILTRHFDELIWDELDDSQESPDSNVVGGIESQVRQILEKANRLVNNDPKLEAVRRILKDKQNLPNNKVMLFSSFIHTLSYLYRHLLSDGFRVGLVSGKTPDEERIIMRDRFQKNKEDADAIDVLLFSEIGCEGLDYQFCDCIVNYDLPWNPMRIEQRIGRIDRNGQESESVAIVNIITPGTIDADIYERCLNRIGVFNRSIGDCEEILGEITREIKAIAEDFTLGEKERREKLQQLADNQIRQVQEQEKLEEKQVELFGIKLPAEQFKREIEEASSFWLTAKSIHNLITNYLVKISGKDQEFGLSDKPIKSLRLSQEVRNLLLQDFYKLPKGTSELHREWERWLKGSNPVFVFTFDANCAAEHSEVALISPIHPFVQQASNVCDLNSSVITSLKVKSDRVPDGEYGFAIYQWQFHGIRSDMLLYPIAQTDELTDCIMQLLENAVWTDRAQSEFPDTQLREELDTNHYSRWVDGRKKHVTRTLELAKYRHESLGASHRARISLLQAYLNTATNEKIRIMRRAQISAAEADYERRIKEIDLAAARADITAQPVAYGMLVVERVGRE